MSTGLTSHRSFFGVQVAIRLFQMDLPTTTKLFHMVSHPLAGYSHSCGRVLREEGDAQGLDLDWSTVTFIRFYYWSKHVTRPTHTQEVRKLVHFLMGRATKSHCKRYAHSVKNWGNKITC